MTRFITPLLVCALTLVAGCDDGGGADADAGRTLVDSGGMSVDSGGMSVDSGGMSVDSGGSPADAAGADGAMSMTDSGRMDPVDGGPLPICTNDYGKPCTSAGDCGGGFMCAMPGTRSICVPISGDGGGCGGFVGRMCPAGEMRSQCLYYSSADFGPCVTPQELECICGTPERRSAFACPDT